MIKRLLKRLLSDEMATKQEVNVLKQRLESLQRQVANGKPQEQPLWEQFARFEKRLYKEIQFYDINDYGNGIKNALQKICEAIHDIELKSTVYD